MTKSAKIFIFSILIMVIGFVLWLSMKQKEKIKNIEYESAKISNVRNIRLISGILVPKREIVLKSKISGIIEELYVTSGQNIKKGDAVARIKLLADPRNVEISEKQLKFAEINLNESETKYFRNKKLFDNGVISKSEFELHEREYLILKEELFSAKKQLEIVKKGFSEGKSDVSNVVYSTISGIVLDLPLKEGSSITESNTFNEGSTIATIADMNEVVFKAKVAEKDIQFLKEGMFFEISVNALNNEKFKTELTNISSKGKEEDGTIKFDIEGRVLMLNNQPNIIRSGYTAVAEIILEVAEQVLTIEEKFVVFVGDSTFIYVIEKNGVKIKRSVDLGISDGVKIQITKGVTVTDKIIEKEEI